MDQENVCKKEKRRWWLLPGFLLLCAYYLYFALPAFRVPLLWDDVMNTHYYWSRPLTELFKANVLFFSSYFRPLGGFFYLPWLSCFGLDPVPLHLFATLLMLLNLVIIYKFAEILSGSIEIGAYAALLCAWHFHLRALYYETGMIYDILGFLFYFGCLLYYVSVRAGGTRLRLKGILISSFLFLCALNAKEICVSLPIMIGLYEILWHPPQSFRPRRVFDWARENGIFVIISGIMAAAYVVGKSAGPDSLQSNPAFKPDISLQVYLVHYSKHIRELFYSHLPIQAREAGIFLGCMLLVSLVFRSRLLAFASVLVIVGFLPIAFIAERNGYAMYIPFGGWVIYAAVLVARLRDLLFWPITAAARSFFSVHPRFGGVLKAAPLLIAYCWFVVPQHIEGLSWLKDSFENDQYGLRSSLSQFPTVARPLPAGAKILFLRDSSPAETPAIYFLTRLYYRDRELAVVRAKESCAKGEAIPSNRYDMVLDYEKGRYFDRTLDWNAGKIPDGCLLPDEYIDQFGKPAVRAPS